MCLNTDWKKDGLLSHLYLHCSKKLELVLLLFSGKGQKHAQTHTVHGSCISVINPSKAIALGEKRNYLSFIPLQDIWIFQTPTRQGLFVTLHLTAQIFMSASSQQTWGHCMVPLEILWEPCGEALWGLLRHKWLPKGVVAKNYIESLTHGISWVGRDPLGLSKSNSCTEQPPSIPPCAWGCCPNAFWTLSG